ncbi:acetate/propionate family kinase [Aliterella atlantica]|uniref:Acetate kinase n=1 Tax=Aliterella atlantica CENA595 TaxID=1618023 RepID=A0A0D8ZV26_9CYAN|nr:acetate kinase [Aliterella atlantica]KJH71096.1 acetate kinase [Aliterella atlantica CENA595]
MKILVLNAGSSSQKSCLYQVDDPFPNLPLEPLWEAKVNWTYQQGTAELKVKTSRGILQQEIPSDRRLEVVAQMLDTLSQGDTQVIDSLSEIDIVGHRVVHGGQDYRTPTIVTPEVKDAIIHLANFAPVHNPANLEGIEAVEQILPDVTQIAVFDTAFHSQLPLKAAVYPIPYSFFEQGIRRYGFHGINHQYCAERTAQLLNRDIKSLRLVTCHLGNGCSLAAIKDGISIDTTMGFTPLEGLMMGSRSGSIDPGILIHLEREHNYNADKLDEMLNKAAGLKGISGISNDIRQIVAATNNSRAQLAIDMYVRSLIQHIGAMLITLGGLDALVFTGGVGENQPFIRAAACEALTFIGVKLNAAKNEDAPIDTDIAQAESSARVLVIQAQEDWAIAKECWKIAKMQ